MEGVRGGGASGVKKVQRGDGEGAWREQARPLFFTLATPPHAIRTHLPLSPTHHTSRTIRTPLMRPICRSAISTCPDPPTSESMDGTGHRMGIDRSVALSPGRTSVARRTRDSDASATAGNGRCWAVGVG